MFPTASLTAFLLLAVSVAANPIVVSKPQFHCRLPGTSISLAAVISSRRIRLVPRTRGHRQSKTERHLESGWGRQRRCDNVAAVYQATVGVGSPPPTSIGVASNSTGFSGLDGVLGSVPTVTDNLFSSGTIPSNLVSVSFEPTTTESEMNGELALVVPTLRSTLELLLSSSPASHYWGIDESIWYGASTLSSRPPLRNWSRPRRHHWLARITSAQFANLQSLFFTTGDTTFELTANAQIWPRALNTLIGGTSGKIYLIVNDIGTPSGGVSTLSMAVLSLSASTLSTILKPARWSRHYAIHHGDDN
ncbi:hypothetical protein B0F90DRAFT_1820026 [Multifurca ochricompacta]|uniref:Uncharacterized protein n=1 Tax=Multifurca ochricompacta TaxID=376703 RepID=A0AAD4QLG2_9AGAM|nr:hypothetical protein B0F90DRAFT_1820026 [Multifurca ochricompacta]